jgi:TctA family transporter
MKIAHSLLKLIFVSSIMNSFKFSLMALWMRIIICEITESTIREILLNSSKQLQAPLVASPLKNLVMAAKLSVEEQLNTNQCLASHFARSLVVSVLPVPTGPSGDPP